MNAGTFKGIMGKLAALVSFASEMIFLLVYVCEFEI
jgi:hypothetical protein